MKTYQQSLALWIALRWHASEFRPRSGFPRNRKGGLVVCHSTVIDVQNVTILRSMT